MLLCYKNIEKGGTPSHPTRDRNPAVPPYLMHKTFSFLTVIAGVTLYLCDVVHVHTGLKGRFRIFRLKISQLPALCQQIPTLCGGFSLWKVPICTSPLHRHVFYEFMPVPHQRNRTMIVGKISPFVNGIDKFFADTVPFRQT